MATKRLKQMLDFGKNSQEVVEAIRKDLIENEMAALGKAVTSEATPTVNATKIIIAKTMVENGLINNLISGGGWIPVSSGPGGKNYIETSRGKIDFGKGTGRMGIFMEFGLFSSKAHPDPTADIDLNRWIQSSEESVRLELKSTWGQEFDRVAIGKIKETVSKYEEWRLKETGVKFNYAKSSGEEKYKAQMAIAMAKIVTKMASFLFVQLQRVGRQAIYPENSYGWSKINQEKQELAREMNIPIKDVHMDMLPRYRDEKGNPLDIYKREAFRFSQAVLYESIRLEVLRKIIESSLTVSNGGGAVSWREKISGNNIKYELFFKIKFIDEQMKQAREPDRLYAKRTDLFSTPSQAKLFFTEVYQFFINNPPKEYLNTGLKLQAGLFTPLDAVREPEVKFDITKWFL